MSFGMISSWQPTNVISCVFSDSQMKRSRIPVVCPRSRSTTRIQALYAPAEGMETLYDLLRVEKNETTAEIKKAYKVMARKYHPDVSPPDRVREHTRRFILVQNAYETLSNPASRAVYDRDLARRFISGDEPERKVEREEQKARWQRQLEELKKRGRVKKKGPTGMFQSWGSRMWAQR